MELESKKSEIGRELQAARRAAVNIPKINGGETIGKGKKMNPEAARRIQSHADKTGKNQDFKARVQKAASKKKD